MSENVKILALRLLDRFDEHTSTQLLLLNYKKDCGSGPYFSPTGGPTGFTGLHGVAFLGIVEIVAAVFEMGEWDINAAGCTGNTVLGWAARRGCEGVVKMLLDRGDVNLNQGATDRGETALTWAALYGHEGAVGMLLESEDVNPHQVDAKYGGTPLLWAAAHWHEGVVKIFLGREDINLDLAATGSGRTPLSYAAGVGHEGVVKVLLEREDVNPNQTGTECGRTPLSWAATNGHEGVVEMLLERKDVNPNTADTEYGRTSLSWAAEWGLSGVVNMLLKREDINPDLPDTEYGRTPLSWASPRGRAGIVEMLLERDDDVHFATPDSKSQTPLLLALSGGHGDVVRILQANANSHPIDRSGQAPLSPSAPHGEECAVEMQPRGHSPSTGITHLSTQPALPLADPDEPEVVLGAEDTVPTSVENELSATEPCCLNFLDPLPGKLVPILTADHTFISQSIGISSSPLSFVSWLFSFTSFFPSPLPHYSHPICNYQV